MLCESCFIYSAAFWRTQSCSTHVTPRRGVEGGGTGPQTGVRALPGVAVAGGTKGLKAWLEKSGGAGEGPPGQEESWGHPRWAQTSAASRSSYTKTRALPTMDIPSLQPRGRDSGFCTGARRQRMWGGHRRGVGSAAREARSLPPRPHLSICSGPPLPSVHSGRTPPAHRTHFQLPAQEVSVRLQAWGEAPPVLPPAPCTPPT